MYECIRCDSRSATERSSNLYRQLGLSLLVPYLVELLVRVVVLVLVVVVVLSRPWRYTLGQLWPENEFSEWEGNGKRMELVSPNLAFPGHKHAATWY